MQIKLDGIGLFSAASERALYRFVNSPLTVIDVTLVRAATIESSATNHYSNERLLQRMALKTLVRVIQFLFKRVNSKIVIIFLLQVLLGLLLVLVLYDPVN